MSWNEYQAAAARRANAELRLRAQMNSHATIRRELDRIREELAQVAEILGQVKALLEDDRRD